MITGRWIQNLALAVVLTLTGSLIGGVAVAQTIDKSEAIAAAQQKNPNLKFTINPKTGMPSGVSGLTRSLNPASLTSSVSEPSDDQVRQAVDAWFLAGEAAEAYAPHNRRAKYETQNVRKDPDLPGQYVAHVEQRLNGIPVFGSSAKVTVDRTLALTAPPVTDSVSAVNIDNTTPQISEADAIVAARAYLANAIKNRPSSGRGLPVPDVTAAAATSQITIFDPALTSAKVGGPTRLAWLVSIAGFRVFIDAKTKEAFYFFRDQPSALLRRVFDLAQSTTFPGQKVIDDQTQQRIEPVNADAQLAYINTGLVRDFYFQVFGRDSYNDNGRATPTAGGPIESYVRFGGLQNAFRCREAGDACPKADVMLFGPDYAGAIDVVGHEITHGVISYEADLVYTDEAGAVNESLADLFGTLIEFKVKGDAGNWLIGESLLGFSMSAPLRDMSNPNMTDSANHSLFARDQPYSLATNRGQPAKYADLVSPSDQICATTEDAWNGCVHINSGIFNKFAYLISEGGEGVTGIGKEKLARIAYRALTSKLNKSTGLIDAASAFVSACNDLAGANVDNIKSGDCEQVKAAQQAVGLVVTN
jgi:Zn-dependent metalloprotease